MVLYELYGGGEVGLVELVGDVPANGTELTPLLDCGMEESHSIQHGSPLGHVADVKLVLEVTIQKHVYIMLALEVTVQKHILRLHVLPCHIPNLSYNTFKPVEVFAKLQCSYAV